MTHCVIEMMLKIISNQYDLHYYKCITGNAVPLNSRNSASARLENVTNQTEVNTIHIYNSDFKIGPRRPNSSHIIYGL